MSTRSNPLDRQFKTWWTSAQPRIIAAAARYVGRSQLGDLVQELAVAALLKTRARGFKDYEHFLRWSLLRCRGLALDAMRLDRLVVLSDDQLDRRPVPDSLDDPRVLVELKRCIEQLPPQQRAVLQASPDRSTREVARDLGIREATVRSLRRHAKATLAARMKMWEESHDG